MELCRSLLLLFIIFLIFTQIQTLLPPPHNTGRGFTLKQLKIQCYNFNTTKLRMEKCEFIAKRETGNLLNYVMHYKGLTNLRARLALYYRGTSGKYQPYILDFEANPCDVTQYNTTNKLIRSITNLYLPYDPHLLKGCPLIGPYNMTNFDLDNTVGPFLPPVLPGKFSTYLLKILNLSVDL